MENNSTTTTTNNSEETNGVTKKQQASPSGGSGGSVLERSSQSPPPPPPSISSPKSETTNQSEQATASSSPPPSSKSAELDATSSTLEALQARLALLTTAADAAASSTRTNARCVVFLSNQIWRERSPRNNSAQIGQEIKTIVENSQWKGWTSERTSRRGQRVGIGNDDRNGWEKTRHSQSVA